MKDGVSPVIIDNTNVQRWQYEKYIDAAEELGYEVKFETLDPTNYSDDFIKELAERQKRTHNVPEHVIIDMLKKWED
jgi:predicted kinase